MAALLKSASIGAITLFTEDLERSKSFYQDAFGLPLLFEDAGSAVFKFDNTLVNLLKIPAARELIDPGTVGSSVAGSRFQLTIGVDDVDAVCVELGQARSGPAQRPVEPGMAGAHGSARPASPILAVMFGRSRRTCPRTGAHKGLRRAA